MCAPIFHHLLYVKRIPYFLLTVLGKLLPLSLERGRRY
jgi:hypothetical protein